MQKCVFVQLAPVSPKTGRINLKETVELLRKQRAYCVSTQSQYRLILKILMVWAKERVDMEADCIEKIEKIVGKDGGVKTAA